MKKFISVLLAALMLMSCFAVVSFASTSTENFAGECNCGTGVHKDGVYCTCCIYCPNPDPGFILGCVDENTRAKCCYDCKGYNDGKPCGCDCTCCVGKNNSVTGDSIDIFSPAQKQSLIDTFQAVLKKISDVFDDLFDRLFEFLRVDEVLGKN